MKSTQDSSFSRTSKKGGQRRLSLQSITNLKNPFGIRHRISYDETGESDIGSRLWKNDGLRHLDVRLASEILWIDVLPKFVGQSFWFRTRGRIRIEATKYNPIPEVLQVTITVPRIAVQLYKYRKYIIIFSTENFSFLIFVIPNGQQPDHLFSWHLG